MRTTTLFHASPLHGSRLTQLTRTLLLAFGLCSLLAAAHAQVPGNDPGMRNPSGDVQAITGIGANNNAPKPVFEGASYFFKISKSEPTRIIIQGSRIRNARAIKEDLAIDKDDDVGQIYITPVNTQKNSTLYITSQSGATFSLLLQPVEAAAKTLSFVEKSDKSRDLSAGMGSDVTAAQNLGLGSYEQAITTLLFAAGSPSSRPPQGIEVSVQHTPVALWKGAQFTLVRSFTSATLVLDQFNLTNTGSSEMRMTEAEFYKPGVAAVAIDRHVLRPSESTAVFIVRNTQE